MNNRYILKIIENYLTSPPPLAFENELLCKTSLVARILERDSYIKQSANIFRILHTGDTWWVEYK